MSHLSERPSDGESLGDISGSSTSSLNPPSVDYLVSIAQLNRELNSIVVSWSRNSNTLSPVPEVLLLCLISKIPHLLLLIHQMITLPDWEMCIIHLALAHVEREFVKRCMESLYSLLDHVISGHFSWKDSGEYSRSHHSGSLENAVTNGAVTP